MMTKTVGGIIPKYRPSESVIDTLASVGVPRGVAERLEPFLAQLATAQTEEDCADVLAAYQRSLFEVVA